MIHVIQCTFHRTGIIPKGIAAAYLLILSCAKLFRDIIISKTITYEKYNPCNCTVLLVIGLGLAFIFSIPVGNICYDMCFSMLTVSIKRVSANDTLSSQ